MDERVDLIILGRKLGTYTGLDILDENAYIFYQFKPEVGIDLPAGDLCVLYDKGLIEYYNDKGAVTTTIDLVDSVKNLPHHVDASDGR